MLVLGRNSGEYVVINDNIIVKVVKTKSGLRLAIEAPKDMKVQRGEVYEETNPRPDCVFNDQQS